LFASLYRKEKQMSLKAHRVYFPQGLVLMIALLAGSAFAGDAVYTTNKDGTAVNQNIYVQSTDVYLSGGPQNPNASGLPDGIYYFQVTDPPGHMLLSTDIALCRQVKVSGGRIVGAAGPPCQHVTGTFDPASGTLPVQLFPFSATPSAGNEYKAWLIAKTATTSISSSDPRVLLFSRADAKTDNFKVQQALTPPPPGSCQGASSLTVLVSGTNVIAYVPKGNWSVTQVNDVSVVNVEGSSIAPTRIPTPNVVNSCASNALTGQTVCTANNTDVYVLTDTKLTSTLNSAGSGRIFFSGGSCTDCGVAMDAIHNRAVIGLSLSGSPGFQVLNLGLSPSFEPPFTSPAGRISEDPLIDPTRDLLLSANEGNGYEIVNLSTSTSPGFFENVLIPSGGELDSSAEECSTGIVLAPAEFSGPSHLFIADLTQATFTAGIPGTWTAPSQVQTLAGSFLSAGPSGSAIAQDTHIGVITGEFGGNTLTAIALPTTSGSGTPAISKWVTCAIAGFSNGFDPHTVTAYQSPNTGDAIALIANAGASQLAVVDLTKMLALPQTGNVCNSGTLPTTVVSFVSVP
jgi:hypothetical protein